MEADARVGEFRHLKAPMPPLTFDRAVNRRTGRTTQSIGGAIRKINAQEVTHHENRVHPGWGWGMGRSGLGAPARVG